MDYSIAAIKQSTDKFKYRSLQYFPTRPSIFIGHEIYVFRSFLFRKNISIFHSTALYPLYEFILKLLRPSTFLLYRFLFKTEQLSSKELLRLYNHDEIKSLFNDDLITFSKGRYRFKFRLTPIANFLVISSPMLPIKKQSRYSEEGSLDYVHIGYDTFTLWNFLKQQLNFRSTQKALEIGCGAGFLSLWLSQHSDSVTSTDINQYALDTINLNAQINQIDNINTVKSDVYNDLSGTYDTIIANPPLELFSQENSHSLHGYGGHLGIEITCRILSGLDSHLTKGGKAFLQVNSYITKSGENTLKTEIEKILGEQKFYVKMFESSYQIRPDHYTYYQRNSISYSITYLIKIERSEKFKISIIPLSKFAYLKERLRVTLLRLLSQRYS